VDTLTREERSRQMSLVKNKDTSPELRVRRAVHALGARYRLHDTRLPGRPDLVFPRRRLALFVHGCFWHRHPNCSLARLPKSRLDFWLPKLEGNRKRDLHQLEEIVEFGWRAEVIWECETLSPKLLDERLSRILEEVPIEVG
jgi:DNA mismatch endonuclease, patch repair protein